MPKIILLTFLIILSVFLATPSQIWAGTPTISDIGELSTGQQKEVTLSGLDDGNRYIWLEYFRNQRKPTYSECFDGSSVTNKIGPYSDPGEYTLYIFKTQPNRTNCANIKLSDLNPADRKFQHDFTVKSGSAPPPPSACPQLPPIPMSVDPTSGNEKTQFKVTLKWGGLTETEFDAYRDFSIYIRAFKSGDSNPIQTNDPIDSYVTRKRQNVTYSLSDFFTSSGGYSIYIRLGIDRWAKCNGYEQGSFPIQLTITNSPTGLKPGDACDPNLQNSPIYKCPDNAPCTRRQLTNEYSCSLVAGQVVESLSTSAGLPCKPKDPNNPGILTAIGCVHTKPFALVADIFRFALGIGGGIAFLLMIIGVLEMITSAGNPEWLKAGHDRFAGAVVGILFIVFSVLLMQIIGVDILRILPK